MSDKNSTRKEKDALGVVQVPKNVYFGSTTTRALNNFQISGISAPEVFIKALGIVKKSAAKANYTLRLLNRDQFKAIEQACNEFISGEYNDQFVVDVFQAGAGTSYNMNANEIIANRANEIMGGKKGKYEFVHPNDHVNLSQSTNDVIPTTIRITILLILPSLLQEIEKLENEFQKKSEDYRSFIKVGRTHLQDAVPITFGQEFDAYKEALKKARDFITKTSENLKTLNIGGTAVGTGLNTDPHYKKLTVHNISKILGIPFKSARNLTEGANNMNPFLDFSSTLRSLATTLLNITGDIKLMGMGPKSGLTELILPEVQPGSSIMPGKINPSIPESIEMICLQALGNDKTIELAAQKSQFELNVMTPVIMYNIVQSTEILTTGVKTFREKCIKGLKVNKIKAKKLYENSLCLATALAPYLGYSLTAEIVKAALKKNITIREEVLSRKIYTKQELNEILSIKATTKPSTINKKHIRKPQ